MGKIILSRLPIHYGVWRRLGLFVHGDMNMPAKSLETYLLLAKAASDANWQKLSFCKEFNVLEIGPGDSIFTALVAKTFGATKVWLIDAGRFATAEPAHYTAMAEYLVSQGYELPFTGTFASFHDVLNSCNAMYLTNGVASLQEISSKSIDFCFSNAVLEHIKKEEFYRFAFELKRIMRHTGICVHRVDLQDHLGGGLANLRFPDSRWEGEFFSKSGFYTNRIRYTEMLRIFKQAGFNCQTTRKISWEFLPISRDALAVEFQQLPDEELLVRGFDVVLSHNEEDLVD